MRSDPSANATAADPGGDPDHSIPKEEDEELEAFLPVGSSPPSSFQRNNHKTRPPRQAEARLWKMVLLTVMMVGLGGVYLDAYEETIQSNDATGTSTSNPSDVAEPLLTDNVMLDKCRTLVSEYMEKLQSLDIHIDGVSDSSWERAICLPFEGSRTISTKPLIIGAGPGSTASRSFAKAVALLGKTVLHLDVLIKPQWVQGSRTDAHSGKGYTDIYKVDDLAAPFINEKLWREQESASIMDFAQVFQSVDALFDAPLNFYVFDLLAAFPNAKIIMTHRDPAIWYTKRADWCRRQEAIEDCVPFVLRPLRLSIVSNMTQEQVVGSFYATERLIQGMVNFDPKRYLQVDAWNRPDSGKGDWMPVIAEFIGVPMPPPETNCSMPVDVDHDLTCGVSDEACKQCDHWMKDHLRR